MSTSDFRSDTVTQPSDAMREAMARAVVGDDVLDGDPTVRELEDETARWLGKARALFVPSGTMANQVALGAWTRPGDEIIVQRHAHVTTYEAGAPGYLHGLQSITVGGIDGAMDPAEVEAAIRPDYVHCPKTGLVCLEQTHNVAGGRIAPLTELEAVARVARESGVPVHMDGARLANAVVATGIPAERWAQSADSVSVCLSKGLGAPVGSLIAGDEEFIERGIVVRKRLGGWMRQAGVIAAGGLYALRHNLERLAEDHALARTLASRLNALPGLAADPDSVATNIVMAEVQTDRFDAAALAARMRTEGVLVLVFGKRVLRFVTHMDVGAEDVARVESVLRGILA
ncbi:MAG: aminotransferase class V-fold PLP-dependent enzyme [Planctomycetota bacterium]|nr:MAG: aminotransferase class V-fold PLP-dependent enzyme [Planctomycetota bacterium]